MTAFAYCRDCNELTTGVMDLSKGFLLGQETNHIDCQVTYLDPTAAPRPIAAQVTTLAVRPELCTNNSAVIFRLALDLHDYTKETTACPRRPSLAPGVKPTSPRSPVHAQQSDASMKSLPHSRPTPITPAREPDLLDLLDHPPANATGEDAAAGGPGGAT